MAYKGSLDGCGAMNAEQRDYRRSMRISTVNAGYERRIYECNRGLDFNSLVTHGNNGDLWNSCSPISLGSCADGEP